MGMKSPVAVCLLLAWSQSLAQNLAQNPPGDRGSCDGGSGDRGSCDRCDVMFRCDCSRLGLTAVPTVTDHAQTLDLAFNNITEIHRGDFNQHRGLRVLSLKANLLSRVDPKAFSSLWSLEELDLSQNLLTSVDHHWFNKLGALHTLRLHQNQYRVLGSPFQALFGLRVLSFGGEVLEEVRGSDLSGVRTLQELHVDANNLKRYQVGALSLIWPLGQVTLSLRTPFLLAQDVATAMICDVSYPETTLVLKDLELRNNLTVLPFIQAVKKRVRHLSFLNMFLTDETLVDILEVTDGALFSTFSIYNTTLKGVGRWEKASRTDHKNVDEVFIRDVEVLDVFQFTSFLPLSFLLQYPRKLSVINAKVFVMPCPTSKLFVNLHYLDLSENLLTDMTLSETLCYGAGFLKDIRVLNFSANSLKSLSLVSQLVTRLTKLTHLDISKNGYSSMPQTCPWPESLRFLNISHAKLTSASSCLPPTLQVLDLSHNDLEGFFLVLPALRELLLSGNKFLALPPGWFFPNLQTLRIQSNTLNTFSRSELLSFPRLQNLEAGNNKFVCSCGFVSFFQRLANGDGLTDANNNRLTDANGDRLTDANHYMKLTDGRQSYTCDSPLHLQGESIALVRRPLYECHRVEFVAVSCGLALLVVVVLGVVLWRVHAFWYLKMTWVWLRAKRRRHSRLEADPPLIRTFDAFVSYSESDAGWVENYLVPELEQTGSSSESSASPSPGPSPSLAPLRLCLHKRDFLPGRWIMDNILTAIQSSRRTIFVLSENFVRSDWCRYELDFTHFHLFEGNCDPEAAILVLLEPLSKDHVPRRFCKLHKLMSSTTYLQWPRDQDLRDQFWTSLRSALREDRDLDQD